MVYISVIFTHIHPPASEARRGVYWYQAQKNFTHPYTEYPWVSVTLSLCDSEANNQIQDYTVIAQSLSPVPGFKPQADALPNEISRLDCLTQVLNNFLSYLWPKLLWLVTDLSVG